MAELRLKLQRVSKGTPDSEHLVDHVIAELIRDGLLSDQRYTAMLIRQASAKGQGPLKLKHVLREKGLSSDVDAALSATEESVDWDRLAADTYERKFGQKPWPTDREARYRERAKRGRFMQQRGFLPEQFLALLEQGNPSYDE